jgi:mRNA interferase MazF
MDMAGSVKRFEVWLADLNPTVGREINKVRPVIIVSEQTTIDFLATVTVVPLTSVVRNLPTRSACYFNGVHGKLVVDQNRSIDKVRLIKKQSKLDDVYCRGLCMVIIEYLKY